MAEEGEAVPNITSTSNNDPHTEISQAIPIRLVNQEEAQPSDDKDGDQQTGPGENGTVSAELLDVPNAKKKKKKKRKPASKRGMGAPTGMEPFFADAPLTPAEFEEQQKIFAKDLPFLDRLLTAIQRFERTRRLSPERRDVFYKWLHHGGIIVGTNAFGGGVNQEEMDKDQIATALSQVQIPEDIRENLESVNSKTPKYTIDFLGCMRSFLSYRALAVYYFAKNEEVELVTTTLERFMDYLMQHDVCPEYAGQILITRDFCRAATDELWSVSEAQRWLPGDFNMACSTLFGGSYGNNYDGETYWGELPPGESAFVGFTAEQATQIVGLGIAGAADEDVYGRYAEYISHNDGEDLETSKVIEGGGFEIIDLENPTADCKDMYKNNSKYYRPVGRLIARPWTNPVLPPEDLTNDERTAARSGEQGEPYIFFMEEVILQHLSVGQKIVATIRQVNCGIWFFDEFSIIYPDYELWTPNEMVEDYKLPKMLPGVYAPGLAVSSEKHEDPDDDDDRVDERHKADSGIPNTVTEIQQDRDNGIYDHTDEGDQASGDENAY